MMNALLLSLLLAQAPAPAKAAPAPQQPTTPPKAAPAQPRPQAPRQPAASTVGGMAITVTDGKGTPFANVSVELTGAAARSGETNAAGQLSIPGLRAGTYRLRFSGEGVVAFEREVTLKAREIAKLPITLTAAEPPKPAAAAPPPPPPPPAPGPVVGPPGQPQVLSVIDLVERELIRNSEPRKDSLVSCSGNTRTMLVQLNDPQAQRVYEDAEVSYYVVAGEGSMKVDGRDVALKAGGYAALPRGTAHAVTRSGRRPLILLATLSGEPCEVAK